MPRFCSFFFFFCIFDWESERKTKTRQEFLYICCILGMQQKMVVDRLFNLGLLQHDTPVFHIYLGIENWSKLHCCLGNNFIALQIKSRHAPSKKSASFWTLPEIWLWSSSPIQTGHMQIHTAIAMKLPMMIVNNLSYAVSRSSLAFTSERDTKQKVKMNINNP